MQRRTFLQTTGLLGLHLSSPWTRRLVAADAAPAFLREPSAGRMLFPRPHDGATCHASPPGLAWLPCPGAHAYRVAIHDAGGRAVYERAAGADPVHVPDRVLEPGPYTWDVLALDAQGTDIARRGAQRFTVAPGAPALPWVDPAVLLARVPTARPRILFPAADLAALRATLSTTRRRTWQACRRAAERALDKGVPPYPTYHRIADPAARRLEYTRVFAEFRRFVNGALMDLSLGFLMTEDTRYAAAAKRILLEIATWPTDDDDVTSVSAAWGDEIGLSFAKCAHIAYDWLYPALNAAERRRVAALCRARAGQVHRRLLRHHYLTYPGESHDGRLIAYLSDMSLSLHDEAPEAVDWLTTSLKALMTFYPHWGGPDGGWAEGTAYGLWYNTFYIPAFEALRQLAGLDLWQRPFFRRVRTFFLYCTANHGEIRPFGDSAETGGPGVHHGSGYAEFMAFHAHRFHDPAVGWWVRQIPGYTGGGDGALALLHPDEPPSAPPRDLPGSRVFRGVGWAGLHSDLTRPAADTCVLFKSSPYGSVSHSHADQNAFAIMKGGTALAIPSGYYGPAYGKPHHAQWTRSTQANNCILVNGRGQVIRSTRARGRITAFQDTPAWTYVAGDATEAYDGHLTRWVRHLLLLRPGVLCLLDDIETPAPATVQWLLHALARMELGDRRVTSRRRQTRLDVHLACAAGLTLQQTDRFGTDYNEGIPPAYRRDKPNHWHVTATTETQARRIRIAACMTVTQDGERWSADTERRADWLGLRTRGALGVLAAWVPCGPGHAAHPVPGLSPVGPFRIWSENATRS